MTPKPSRTDIEQWLTQHGWFPERDIGDERLNQIIQVEIEDSARQGAPLAPGEHAKRFLRSFGDLELPYPRSPEVVFSVTPAFGYEGDAKEITELGTSLRTRLFPVGFESGDNLIVLVDETGRFFCLHFSGAYFLGNNEFEAFTARLWAGEMQDAEDFFV